MMRNNLCIADDVMWGKLWDAMPSIHPDIHACMDGVGWGPTRGEIKNISILVAGTFIWNFLPDYQLSY